MRAHVKKTSNPALPKREREELAALVALADQAIDLTDSPEVRDWSAAVVGRFYRPVKEAVTLRLDADVLAWLRSRGPGYQTRINRLLRAVMQAQSARVTATRRMRRGRS